MGNQIEIAVTAWKPGTNGFAEGFCEQAKLAEQLGFHSFWLPESHFGDTSSIPSPLTLLAAVAATTRSIKLGTSSYLITIRNPLQAAEEVAVLDRLSAGRLILGLGRGVQKAMFKAFELPTKDKRKRFKENLTIMRNAWSGGVIAIDDEGEPIYLAPRPIQQPHPPLWIAAFGPLALKQAGNLALPYLASPIETLDVLEQNYKLYNQVVANSGAAPVTTIPIMRTIFITNNQSRATQLKLALDTNTHHTMREPGANIDDWTLIGDASYVKDKLSEYVERLGVTVFIARGRLPGIGNQEQVKSHEALLGVSEQIR